MAQKTTVTAIAASEDGQLSLAIVGDALLQTLALPGVGRVTLGRAAECEVRIDDSSISRSHATLTLSPLSIVDHGSANGTWVANQRIAPNQPVEVRLDEAIRLGSVTVLVQRRLPPPVTPVRRLRSHAYFEGRLDDECARAQRNGTSFTVVHVAGDAAIDQLDLVAGLTRDSDVVASYAPDELEILLAESAPEHGQHVVRELEAALVGRGIEMAIGFAWFPRDGRDPSALLGHARRRAHGQVDGEAANIVVADERMTALHQLVTRVARADISVLLHGETGVGKEVIAEALHRQSSRADKPFVKLNCAALSETLLESELFGHERGAFTGAIAAKLGLLEVAEGGVVFLDEVGELLLATQAKLLRVLDERKLLRVGGLQPRAIDVRIISATNRDLDAEVRRGAFRLDLLYRLNAMSIVIPPLRERTAEILPLARTFLETLAAKLGRPVPRLTDAAQAMLRDYAWPGNVRELRNVIERALVLATGEVIDASDLPEDKMRPGFAGVQVVHPAATAPPREPAIASDERQAILDALEACKGNQTHAAKLLGVSRRTLINKLEKFAMPRPRKK